MTSRSNNPSKTPKFTSDGLGTAGWLLAINVLTMLKMKGVLSDREVSELIEIALLSLEEGEMTMPPAERIRIQSARLMLDALRQRLGHSRSSKSKKI